MTEFQRARTLLREFKGEAYVNGLGVLPSAGQVGAELGRSAVLVHDSFAGAESFVGTVYQALAAAGVRVLAEVIGAGPNAPREDMARIASDLTRYNPEFIISFGGGSTIDAAKAAEVLRALGGDIEEYFGVGLVSQQIVRTGKALRPHLAIQTASTPVRI